MLIPDSGRNCQRDRLPMAAIFERLADQKIALGLSDQAERLSQLAVDLRAASMARGTPMPLPNDDP